MRITSTCICGSDLHMYEGRTDIEAGFVFGHEPMGIVEEVGPAVVSVKQGDRVSMPFNVGCGFCFNCERGYSGACLTVNPGNAGGAYGYADMGPYTGGQAEFLRVRSLTSTACSCRRGRSTSRTLRCWLTSSPRAITALSWRRSSQGRRWLCGALGRWG